MRDDKDMAAAFTRNSFIAAAVLTVVAFLIEVWAYIAYKEWFRTGTLWTDFVVALVIVLLCAALITCAVAFATKSELFGLKGDIDQMEFQIDLYSHKLTERELKAEKLLRINDFQLRRYYDMNLRQNRQIFVLGVCCIVAGVAVVFGTLYILNTKSTGSIAQITTAALGGIGAILTNFVAAIYLKMNASASDNLVSFHGRLVGTHQLMLGNLLASRIDDDKLRWDTLASLALRLAPGKEETTK
jgi:hypothetical protein